MHTASIHVTKAHSSPDHQEVLITMSSRAALCAQLRGILSEMIISLSDADDFHYTINPETTHYGFSLCHRLGMTPRDYGTLLVGANLARIKEGKLIMMPTEIETFINGGDFSLVDGTVQYSQKQIRLEDYVASYVPGGPKRSIVYCVRIGRGSKHNLYADVLDQTERNGKLIETPPRLSCLRQLQRQFGAKIMAVLVKVLQCDDKLYNYFMVDDNNKHTNTTHQLSATPSPLRTKRLKYEETAKPTPSPSANLKRLGCSAIIIRR